jgi:hypothetical protein
MANVVIRGMKMPTNGFDCPLNSFGICNLAQDEKHCNCIEDFRPEWCLLSPLPEGHGRLGDLDKLYAIANERSMGIYGPVDYMCVIAGSDILNAPTIIPADGGMDDDN